MGVEIYMTNGARGRLVCLFIYTALIDLCGDFLSVKFNTDESRGDRALCSEPRVSCTARGVTWQIMHVG
jgi:hypothetical protein